MPRDPLVQLVTVCDACGRDICRCGENKTKDVPACQHRSDRDGRQCARPERAHTSGWSHAFEGQRTATRPGFLPAPATAEEIAKWRGGEEYGAVVYGYGGRQIAALIGAIDERDRELDRLRALLNTPETRFGRNLVIGPLRIGIGWEYTIDPR